MVRGKRAKAGSAPPLEEQDPLRIRLKKAWQELLKRIYEVDPLRCPCGGTLKRIALITDPKVIKKIQAASTPKTFLGRETSEERARRGRNAL